MFIVRYMGRTLVAFLLLATTLSVALDMDEDIWKNRKVTRLSAVVGGEVMMPCDIRPPTQSDRLTLVVWYKIDDPIYSYDIRKEGSVIHWVEEPFTDRIHLMGPPNTGLRLEDIQPDDRAIFTCRVEFDESPSMKYWISLDVIELPGRPVITDEFGKEIKGKAGPYNEGSEFKLMCSVKGGVPSPRIQWQRNDVTLATLGAGDSQAGMTKSLVLVTKNASREHLSSLLTCTTDNTPLAPPQKASVTLDLYLRPLTVEIISKEQPLSVGRKADLSCRSTGARPAANITWWLGSKLLQSITKFSGPEDANETQSVLQWVPLKQDNGQVAICRAEHSKFNRSAIESKLPLNIYYEPETMIHLGANLNPNDIEEGDDVYFGCTVDANPPAYKVVWEHNGVQLQHNPSNGVMMSGNNNLVLRNVNRSQAGKYACTASNVEGDGKSEQLSLSIIYKPICKAKEMKVQGAALQEPTTVVCEVEAFPRPDTFEWTLNSSAGSAKVDPDRFTIEMHQNRSTGRSILTFTPVSEIDYGTLSCRATNLAGQQVAPCVYTLLPATRPDPPTNCTVYNLTHDSLDLMCLAGYEGGLQSVYIAEVWAREGLAVNATSGSPLWNLRRLGPERQLRVVAYAANARGRSDRVTIAVKTVPRLGPRTEAQEAWEVNWAMGIVLGAVLTISLILCLALVASKLRHRSQDYEVSLPPLKNQVTIEPERTSSSLHGADDKNPDLIPLRNGLSASAPQPPSYAALVANRTNVSGSAHSLPRHHHSPTTAIPHGYYTDSQSELGRGMNVSLGKFHREVVTTRTPLLAAQQESRV